MKLYLSSYKIGNEGEQLKEMMAITEKGIGYIPNALDFTKADLGRRNEIVKFDIHSLQELGVEVEVLDLRTYFGKKNELSEKLETLGGVFVSGGNTFVLRQAMKISGFDDILLHDLRKRNEFVYAGYSAAGCVLSPSLKCYQIVDDPTDMPYEKMKEIIWTGLGIIDFAFMPHYDSDHGESEDIDKEIDYCNKNKIPFKVLHDGEVLITV